jgi:probable HAF family extracellular repeat protein
MSMKKPVAALTAAAAVVAVTLLSACSSGASQDPTSAQGFVPSRAAPQNVVQPAQSVGVQKVVTHYRVVKLGTLGGNFSNANAVNNRSWVVGPASLQNNAVHGALWLAGHKTDLGTLGGPNSSVPGFDHNTRGVISGISETSPADPYGEQWCGPGSSRLCGAFRWRNGVMTPLPTLGGNNSVALDVNNRDQVLGSAETSTQDPTCQAPQVFDYYAVIWQPDGTMVTLPPYPGDVISSAISLNQKEQVVGSSGLCYWDQPQASTHAVLWQNGSAIDLGNLGGSQGNVGNDINDNGQIVGGSGVPGNQVDHAFLWQKGVGMTDLGTLPGDVWSFAYGINNKGQIVGESCDSGFYHCRGFIWQNGSMTDLNLLVPPNSKTYLQYGGDINDRGQIASATVDVKTGNQLAVLLVPGKKAAVIRTGSSVPKVTLPASIRMQLKRSWGMGHPFEKP